MPDRHIDSVGTRQPGVEIGTVDLVDKPRVLPRQVAHYGVALDILLPAPCLNRVHERTEHEFQIVFDSGPLRAPEKWEAQFVNTSGGQALDYTYALPRSGAIGALLSKW